MIARLAISFVVAALVAIVAHRARMLTRGGTVAATITGTLAFVAGWQWAAALLAFFLSSTALSRVGRRAKHARTAGVLEKEGARDAMQVVANGGLFALAAAGHTFTPSTTWMTLGAGAIAAATADTWATEIGTLAQRPPRLVTTWSIVPPGTSGAVTAIGTVGMILGSAFVALIVAAVGWSSSVALAALLGGLAGTSADTLLGATVQARRRCVSCDAPTERAVHSCGSETIHVGGARWLDNDIVNVLCTATGALVALAI